MDTIKVKDIKENDILTFTVDFPEKHQKTTEKPQKEPKIERKELCLDCVNYKTTHCDHGESGGGYYDCDDYEQYVEGQVPSWHEEEQEDEEPSPEHKREEKGTANIRDVLEEPKPEKIINPSFAVPDSIQEIKQKQLDQALKNGTAELSIVEIPESPEVDKLQVDKMPKKGELCLDCTRKDECDKRFDHMAYRGDKVVQCPQYFKKIDMSKYQQSKPSFEVNEEEL